MNASDVIYNLVNCATGFTKLGGEDQKKMMKHRKYSTEENNVNPYINGSFDWCPDLKKMKAEFSPSKIRQISLYGEKITAIDEGLLRFAEIEELSLSGNLIHSIDNKNLSPSLKVLHLNGNKLDALPNIENLTHLIHLGLAYNTIRNTLEASKFIPSGLVSLDLSWNKIVNLKEIAESLSGFRNLKNLVLLGNPICLLPSYQAEILTCMPGLMYFDEKYSKNIPISSKKKEASNIVCISVKVNQINFLKRPTEEASSPEAKEEFEYSLALQLEHYDSKFETSNHAFDERPLNLNFLGTLRLVIDEDVKQKLGLILYIRQSRYNITTVPVGPTPKGGKANDKGKKAKEEVEIVKSLVSMISMDSQKCYMDEFLKGTYSFTQKVTFEGLATVDLEFAL